MSNLISRSLKNALGGGANIWPWTRTIGEDLSDLSGFFSMRGSLSSVFCWSAPRLTMQNLQETRLGDEMGDIKYYGKRRSIIRRIGSFLPLKPLPKIYVSVTPLHLMTNSMINEETSRNYVDTNGYPISRPDLLEPISFGSEVRLLALEQELQELREQISTIVKNNKLSKYASVTSLPNGADDLKSVPPPPPPLPPFPLPLPLLPPTTPHIARRASLQDHKIEDRKKISLSGQKLTGDTLKDIDNVKLRPVARYPRLTVNIC
ncbi:mitochondrial fission regulator 2 isoform X3 [Solenopsis invicta]|uniref:mitochondrial fission regulator 2 isoform X3 n=1 Tax=Solenopsis invicta TaxID=13686 RepID=UPI00193E8726|nr:mitochondrial fission regulator 2 isoform X3 [Solenopsis invicta]